MACKAREKQTPGRLRLSVSPSLSRPLPLSRHTEAIRDLCDAERDPRLAGATAVGPGTAVAYHCGARLIWRSSKRTGGRRMKHASAHRRSAMGSPSWPPDHSTAPAHFREDAAPRTPAATSALVPPRSHSPQPQALCEWMLTAACKTASKRGGEQPLQIPNVHQRCLSSSRLHHRRPQHHRHLLSPLFVAFRHRLVIRRPSWSPVRSPSVHARLRPPIPSFVVVIPPPTRSLSVLLVLGLAPCTRTPRRPRLLLLFSIVLALGPGLRPRTPSSSMDSSSFSDSPPCPRHHCCPHPRRRSRPCTRSRSRPRARPNHRHLSWTRPRAAKPPPPA